MRVRPRYHITAPSNWLNDPNGPIHHAGRYHLFYQYNPLAPRWGRTHWGHVSSSDLLHWDNHPVALTPSTAGPDREGCWSGCTRIIDGRPTIFYTGVVGQDHARVESVCRADGSPDLMTWTPRSMPLISGPPNGLGTSYHRDPFVFRHADRWRMLLGSGLQGPGGRAGAILLYESIDLASWKYVGVLYQRPEGGDPIDTGPLWECPQLLRLHGQDVLIFSVQTPEQPRPLRYAVYVIGSVDDTTFHPNAMGLIDHGDVFYAPAVTTDATGRHLMWGWLQETTPAKPSEADHVGALSLPRQLDLLGDRLTISPVPELGAVRTLTRRPSNHLQPSVPEGQVITTPGHHYELALAVKGRTGTATIDLLDAAGTSALHLNVNRADHEITLQPGNGEARTIHSRPPHGVGTDLRIFVDASIVEVFINDECAATTRAYDHDGARLRLRTEGDVTTEVSLYTIATQTQAAVKHGR